MSRLIAISVLLVTLAACAAEQGQPMVEDAQQSSMDAATAYSEGLAALQAEDYFTAADRFRAGADAGHVPSTVELAKLHETGDGVIRDQSEAARLYRVAADNGDVFAQNRLGDFYHRGRGVPRDGVMAATYWRMAAGRWPDQA